MRNDYHILMDLVKRSTEDVSFMLHLVAQQYLHHLDNAYGKSVGLNPMIRKEDRKSFETFFHSSCVNPVLEGCLQRSQLQTVKSTCDVSSDEQLVFLNAEVTEMDDFDEYTRRSSRISRTDHFGLGQPELVTNLRECCGQPRIAEDPIASSVEKPDPNSQASAEAAAVGRRNC